MPGRHTGDQPRLPDTAPYEAPPDPRWQHAAGWRGERARGQAPAPQAWPDRRQIDDTRVDWGLPPEPEPVVAPEPVQAPPRPIVIHTAGPFVQAVAFLAIIALAASFTAVVLLLRIEREHDGGQVVRIVPAPSASATP